MDDDKQLALELEHDPFAEPPKRDYLTTLDRVEGRVNRPEQEWIRQSNTLYRFASYPRFERGQIKEYIWKFRHPRDS